jgi:hypothetical protein
MGSKLFRDRLGRWGELKIENVVDNEGLARSAGVRVWKKLGGYEFRAAR